MKTKDIKFNHLMVAQFNLQQKFIDLVDREMENAREGIRSAITIKLNNLEERVLIKKLYQASNAGVKITLIIRNLCCLIPGVRGMSENITVKHIADRYLEHGRIFAFYNNGAPEVYMGSVDWMNRNLYGRVEVSFPVHTPELRQQVMDILEIQLSDTVNTEMPDDHMQNIPGKKKAGEKRVQSQVAISDYLQSVQ